MISLKPFSLSNAGKHYEWNNDEELTYLDSDYPFVEESYESFTHRISAVANPEIGNNRILEIYADDHLIGAIGLYGIDHINRRCRLELMIGDRSARDKGHGRHALLAALKHCFEVMEMHKVTTAAFDFNKKWIHLVQDLGFRQEGVLRDHAIKSGNYTDKMIFGLLEQEYAELIRTMREAEAV